MAIYSVFFSILDNSEMTPAAPPPPPPHKKKGGRQDVDWTVFRNPSLYSFCSPGFLILLSVLFQVGALITACFVWCFDNEFNEIVLEVRAIFMAALWARIIKSTDWSTEPLARPITRSLAPLTRLLLPHYLLCSRAPLRSLFCWLADFAHSLACGTVIG